MPRIENLLEEMVRKQSAQTPAGENITARKENIFSVKPTYGTSALRDIVDTQNGGAVGEVNGELRLTSHTDANGFASLSTAQRGRYRSGSQGEFGVGIRLGANKPIENQTIEWGYFDSQNGFGFGEDAIDLYVFVTRGGSKTIIYRKDWNENNLAEDIKASLNKVKASASLNVRQGNIFSVDFVWYGYGTIEFFIGVLQTNLVNNRVRIHKFNFEKGSSIFDPNQNIKVEVKNNGTANNPLEIFVGGRQFTLIGGGEFPFSRILSEKIEQYTIPSSNVWYPIITLKEKATFGDSGRTNTVRAIYSAFQGTGDFFGAFRVTIGGTASNGTFSNVEYWGNESAVKSIIRTQTGNENYNSTVGYPIKHRYFGAGGNSVASATEEREIFFGEDFEITLWVKKFSGSGSTVNATLEWSEDW